MKHSVLLIVFLLSTQNICAQNLDWVTELKTPDDSYSGINLSISDGAGGVYFLTGAAYPTTLVSPSTSINLAFDEVNNNGANIVRLDASGEMVFQVNIGIERTENNGYFSTQGLTVDDNGNLYVGGYVARSTTISVGDVSIPIAQNLDERKYGLILKFSNTGSLLNYKLFNVNKDFYHRFFSMDFYDGNLYVLYALIDSAVEGNGGGDEYLFTHHITVYDLSWNPVKSKSFSGKSRNTGSSGDPRRQFMMSGIKVFDNEQVYLSGVIQNGQGSDLDESIVTDNPAMVSSVIKLDENLNFEWFRGIQGYNTSPYTTGIALLDNGDVVLNSFIYSYNGFPTSLIGNSIDEIILPHQFQNSTRQVFLTSEGGYNFQTVFEGALSFSDLLWSDSENIYFPFTGNDVKSLKFIDQESEVEIYPKYSSGGSIYHTGYLKISKEGRYQSHNLFNISEAVSQIDNQILFPGLDCGSFFFLGRYGGDNGAVVDIDFDENVSSEIQNLNDTYDYFIASYSNQKAELIVDQQSITQDGNQLTIPISFNDESVSDLVFEVTSSNESILNTDNVVFNLRAEQPNIVVHRAEGANGSADIQIKIIDSCGEETSVSTTVSLDYINHDPVFITSPITEVDDNEIYKYNIEASDIDGDIISFSTPILPNWLILEILEPNTVTTYAGTGQLGTADGSVETASFSYPTALVFDDMGNMYVADQGWDLIRKISNTGQVTTIAGGGNGRFNNGQGQEASFDGPTGLVLDKSGNLYVSDAFNHLIRKITPEGLVSTFAGSTSGFADGIGAGAKFDQPGGLVIDSSDNIYVADVANNRIRKISPNGEVTTLAGNGNMAFADGNGASSSFYFPINITIDSDDNLYVSDTYNNRIRKITPSGDVTTLAGSTAGYLDGPLSIAKFNKPRGIALDSEGNIYVAEEGNYDIRKISKEGIVSTLAGNQAPGNNDGVGINAGLREPTSMILGKDGLLYFTDPLAQRIRTLSLNKAIQLRGSAIGQNGVHPVEIVADDNVGGTVSQLFSISINDVTNPVFTSATSGTFAENEMGTAYTITATDASSITYSLGVSNDEGLFDVNETTGEVTFKVSPDFENPKDVDKNNSYLVEVLAIDALNNSSSLTVIISVTNADNEAPIFTSIPVTEVNENGLYEYVVDAVDPDGDVLSFLLEEGPEWVNFPLVGEVTSTDGIGTAFTKDDAGNIYAIDGNQIKRVDAVTGQITLLAGSGEYASIDGTGVNASFYLPMDIELGPDGLLYVADTRNNLIRRVTLEGEVSTYAGVRSGDIQNPPGPYSHPEIINGSRQEALFSWPTDIEFDTNGNMYIADSRNYIIRKIDTNGEVTNFAGKYNLKTKNINGFTAREPDPGYLDGASDVALFHTPSAISVDVENNVYVADQYNHRIRKISPQGFVTTIAGSTQGYQDGDVENALFSGPTSIIVDSDNRIFVGESARIRVIEANGLVGTIAGDGSNGLVDGVGTQAQLRNTSSMKKESVDQIMIADGIGSKFRTINIGRSNVLSGRPNGAIGNYPIVIKSIDVFGSETTQSFSITVNDITPPVFTSSTSSTFVENGTGIAYTITATDANDVTYSLGVGNDEGLFDLVGDAVTFKTIPDFEAPTDGDTDNAYVIRVKASDGVNEVSQLVTISVTDTDETPVIISTPVTSVKESIQYVYGISIESLSNVSYTLEAETLPDWMTLIGKNAVTKYAGSGEVGQDNGALLSATFNIPLGITRDEDDNLYVTDLFNHVIRKVSNSGHVSTIAGTGAIGYVDGTASEATFNEPSSIVIDSHGNLYVADRENHAVRKISLSGEVSTFAGNGQRGYMDGQGTSAQFSRPTELAIDSNDNIYVTDQSNYRVRKISPEGVVSTIAGNGDSGYVDGDGTIAQFSQLTGITVDLNGNIYVSDYDNHRIRKINPQGNVSTLAGSSTRSVIDGLGAEAAFYSPFGMAIDENFNIYITDQRYVRKITPDGQVTTIAGSNQNGNTDGEGLSASFNEPHGVVIDSKGDLFITESSNNFIRRVSLKDHTLVGNPLNKVGIHNVSLKSRNSNGETDVQSFSVEVLDATPPVFTSASTATFTENEIGTVYTIAATDYSSITYALGASNDEELFDVNETTGEVTFKVSPDFENPQDSDTNNSYVLEVLATDALDNSANLTVTISVANADNEAPVFTSTPVTEVNENELYEYFVEVSDPDKDAVSLTLEEGPEWLNLSKDSNNMVSTLAGSGDNSTVDGIGQEASFSFLTRLSIDNNGDLYLGELGSKTIRKVSPNGNVTTLSVVSDGTRINGTLSESSFGEPNKILIDDSSGVMYVLDGSIIRKIDTEGNVSDFAGSGFFGNVDGQGTEARFTTLMGGAIDSQGNLYVADFGNHSIRKITSAGLVTTLAGSGTEGYADGTGIAASFNRPFDIAINSNDIVFVADEGNDRIRRIEPNGEVTTFAGSGVEGFLDGDSQNAMFFEPKALDFDSRDNLFVADWGNNRVRKITSSGDVSTIAGNGQGSYSDGNALEAGISGPIGLTVDSNDNIYVSTVNYRVRKITIEENYLLSGTAIYQSGIKGVELRVDDGFGGSAMQIFNITVNDITPPVFTSPTTVTYTENETGTAYTIVATDANDITYSLGTGNDESFFNLTEGVVTFKASPDFETKSSYTIQVKANDGSNESAQTVTITIIDVDEIPPVFTSATAVNYAENGTGTAYTIVATDANDITYSLGTGNDEDFFDIASGVVTFKTSPDFETKSSYTIQVKANDGLKEATQNVTISVTNVNEAPTELFINNTSIEENNEVGGEMGQLTTADQDAGDTHSYTLVSGSGDTDNALFEIAGNKLAAKSSFDFEAKASYSVRIKATDVGGLSFEDNFIITITNQAEAILRIEGGQSAETTNVGETSTLEISIFNDGDGVMEVSSIAYPDGFTGPATIDAIAPSASKSITVSFAPTEAKTYSGDIVISYNGGSGIKSVVAVAEVVTSIDNGFIDEVAVSIYPNPANDRITIDLSQYNGRPVEVSIFNESGHGLYKRSNIRHLTHDVEVSNYVQGIYIVLVKSEIGVVRKKLMIFR